MEHTMRQVDSRFRVEWTVNELFIMRPSCRPHYASRLSVRLSVPSYGLVTRKQKNVQKIKIGIKVLHGTYKWNANCQLKRSKVNVTGRQKPQQTGITFRADLSAAHHASAARLQTRPAPLLGCGYMQNKTFLQHFHVHGIAAGKSTAL